MEKYLIIEEPNTLTRGQIELASHYIKSLRNRLIVIANSSFKGKLSFTKTKKVYSGENITYYIKIRLGNKNVDSSLIKNKLEEANNYLSYTGNFLNYCKAYALYGVEKIDNETFKITFNLFHFN